MAKHRLLVAKVSNEAKKRNKQDGIPRPFLRWVGGKYHLTSVLLRFAPEDVHEREYYEPFLGAGSMFFALQHGRAHLSDLNAHLIDCYNEIRVRPGAVASALASHVTKDNEDYYYITRDLYNRSRKGVARAARFIYLNRTCFNGVFRVNTKGAYNVPYGRKQTPRFPSRADLHAVSVALKGARLEARDYIEALKTATRGDFVYLDPPYPPLNGTSFFTHYTPARFGHEQQRRLAECVQDLHRRGCLIMLSNADTSAIRRLYAGFHLSRLSVRRFVSASNTKHRVNELIITNYSPPPAG